MDTILLDNIGRRNNYYKSKFSFKLKHNPKVCYFFKCYNMLLVLNATLVEVPYPVVSKSKMTTSSLL